MARVLRYVTTDAMGSVTSVLSSTGEVLERRSYDAFGKMTCMLPDGTPVPTSPTGLKIGFQGQHIDELTGMYQMGYRWYSPVLGRWVSRDPIGLEGGINGASFVENYPVGAFDLDGLAPLEFGDPGYLSSQIRRAELAKKESPAARCKRMRNARLAEISKIASGRSSPPVGCGDAEGCELISVLISIADPCMKFPESLSGHAGIGIGNDFFDFGPIKNATYYEKGSQWWDRPSYVGWNDSPPGKTPSEINLPDVLKHLSDLSTEPVVIVEYCACKNEANSMRSYWNSLYAKIDLQSVGWTPLGLSCTSAVCESVTGNRPVISPDGLLELLSSSLKNTCGGSKGRSASVTLKTRVYQTRPW